MSKQTKTSSRKRDHLVLCAEKQVERGSAGFEDVKLVHNALTECSLNDISTSCRFLGRQFEAPIFIAAMTGGHPDTLEVNARLAAAAETFGIGMGVGSQRAALENPELEDSFMVVREAAPHAFLCGNLGIVQLRDHGIEWADRAVEMIDAQALCIHLNPLQEVIQPEGDHDLRGCADALQELCRSASYPVIVKETGSGISAEAARLIWGAGAAAIDLGGSGGTSWAAVECLRADRPDLIRLGTLFLDWGIPTVTSLIEVSRIGGPVIATGGVRSGIDIAKSISLGAGLCGMALPLLRAAMEDDEAVISVIAEVLRELQVAMFLTGSRDITELTRVRAYITGHTREMIQKEE